MTGPHPPITESTAFKLHRATVLIDRIADEYLLREHGIRYAPFLVLMIVGLLAPTSQQAIAANLAVSRASVTQRLGGLVADGLVAVTTDPEDSRANRVSLTPAGSAKLDAAWRGLEAKNDGIDEGVDEPALAAHLDRLIANAMRIIGSET